MRGLSSTQRFYERESKKRQKELERRLKEQEKLSTLERARLEVDSYDNEIDLLLSVHKEQSNPVDWRMLSFALPPHTPPKLARNELTAMLNRALMTAYQQEEDVDSALQAARSVDEQEYKTAYSEYQKNMAEWERLHSLAPRILAGEASAYIQATSEFPALAEITTLGSSIHIIVHEPAVIECVLKVKNLKVIPSEAKTLTASGKVSIKPMPKAKAHEIYQDYVCGCILRLAREIFALLPVQTALLTAAIDGIDSRTGHRAELPVLSLVAPRSTIERLNYDQIDPSDALENFQHRGDVKASRKAGDFVRITPLKPEDISSVNPKNVDFMTLVAKVREFRTELEVSVKSLIEKNGIFA